MMRWLLRIAATIVIALGAVFLLWRFVAVPYGCNARLRAQMNVVKTAFSASTASFRAVSIARDTARDLEPCVAACPDNIALQMVLAAGYRAAGLNDRAAAVYERALQYDRRPELYLNLGQTQLARGETKDALQNLTLACIYNPTLLNEIGRFHPEVRHAVDLYQARLFQGRPPGTQPRP